MECATAHFQLWVATLQVVLRQERPSCAQGCVHALNISQLRARQLARQRQCAGVTGQACLRPGSKIAIETGWPSVSTENAMSRQSFGLGLGEPSHDREFPVVTELACPMSRQKFWYYDMALGQLGWFWVTT